MGEFPSGQRGQTVNLLAMPSMVRIHLPPPKIPITLLGDWYFSLRGRWSRSLSSEGGNPSSPTKNTDCPSGRSVFFFFPLPSSLFPHSLLFPFETCRFRESVIVNTHRKRILQQHRNARQMHGAEKNLDRLRQHREEKPHMIRPPTVWAGFCCSAPSRSRCAQARGQLPPRQAAHERVKAIGAHRQPAVRARPQVRIFPRRQRRKTHLASPHPHSSLPAAKLLCIWITFALSLYSLE